MHGVGIVCTKCSHRAPKSFKSRFQTSTPLVLRYLHQIIQSNIVHNTTYMIQPTSAYNDPKQLYKYL